MSTKSRLQAMTAELVIPDDALPPVKKFEAPSEGDKLVETRFPPASQRPSGFKTAPGQMLAFRGQMLETESELSALRSKLEQYAESMPTKKLDTSVIEPSRWANRHNASYTTVKFLRLKDDIEQAGGNVQPILVRPKNGADGHYEIVFGHRRHMACKKLGIPVLASIANDKINDLELFAAMDRENRERADLSSYEQGVMYQRALDEGLFPSRRNMAESLGVSHTWVNNALLVANLPVAIIECFKNPLEVTHRHARLINDALEKDRKQVLKRAEKIRAKGLSAGGVLTGLLESQKPTPSNDIVVNGKKIGKIQRKGDSVMVALKGADLGDEQLVKLQFFLVNLISGNQVSTDS